MRFSFLLIAAGAMLVSSPVSAQTVIDDYESYADAAAIDAKYDVVVNSGNEAMLLGTPDGADGTSQYLDLRDDGFSYSVTGTDLVSAPAGDYIFSFFYKNGGQGGTAMRNLAVSLNQGGSSVHQAVLHSGSSDPAPVTNWTKYQSPVITLTGDPVTLVITANGGNPTDYNSQFDQFILTTAAGAPLELEVSPHSSILLSRTELITAEPAAGSGSGYSIEFDVNNDGSVEHTDATAPYEFNWDTLTAVPQDTTASVALRVRVTDDSSSFTEVITNYIVDNRYNGRESMITNGDFSQFQGPGTGANGNNLPVGWVDFQTTRVLTGEITFGPAPGRNVAAGDALQFNFAASGGGSIFDNRYPVRTIEKVGNWQDLQVTYWGIGSSNRMYYAVSTDGGVTYTVLTGTAAAQVNNSSWAFASAPPQNLNLADDDSVSLVAHQFAAGIHMWDDITFEGILVPPGADVEEWNLY